MKLPNPYIGIAPPPGIAVPDPDLLIRDLCSEESPRECFAYPPEAPVFWIKYGHMVYWNEVCAQVMAYEGLRQLGSKVRAPAVFYAQMNYPYTYIIMEYVPGKTAGECLEAAQDDSARELLAQSVSLAISELHRIPIEPGTRPAAISGDKIRHCLLFEDYGSPLHYENVQHMEDHFNAFLESVGRPARFKHLAQEPLVFCQSDLYPDNFIISETGSHVTVIDFAETSIVPASFAKFAVSSKIKQGFELRRDAHVPMATGIDNLDALRSLSSLLVTAMGFERIGERMPGGDAETQARFDQLYSDHPETDNPLPPGGRIAESQAPSEEPVKRPCYLC